MASTVTLRAESVYGKSGQYIARLMGRAPQHHFRRQFVGTKYGKRSESTSYETDEVGLYEVCDLTKRGKDKTYVLVLPFRDGLCRLVSDCEDALAIAKRLDGGERLEDFVVASLGEELTTTEFYYACAECGVELSRDATCDAHPDAARAYTSRIVAKLDPNGKPLHRIVYTIRTKGEANAAEKSATLDSAIDAIAAALRSIPEKSRPAAIKAAKEKLAETDAAAKAAKEKLAETDAAAKAANA